MKTQMKNLTPNEMKEVVALIRECEAYDNASSCVQLDHALNGNPDMDSWFLVYRDSELAGLASVFAPSRLEAELSICVAPSLRKAGLANHLLKEATDHMCSNGVEVVLLVCDRKSEAGCRMASMKCKEVQHTEYSMKLERPFTGFSGNRITFAEASLADLPNILEICLSAYGDGDRDFDVFLRTSLTAERRKGYVGYYDGVPAATCFLGFQDDSVSINTVAVHKKMQGKGIAKEFLTGIICMLEPYYPIIELEVDSTNTAAYQLYQKLGFKEVRAVDYHILILNQ